MLLIVGRFVKPAAVQSSDVFVLLLSTDPVNGACAST